MSRSLITRVLVVLPFATLTLAAQLPGGHGGGPPMHRPGEISTSATGEARYIPDRATISLGVTTRAATAALASAQNATKQQAVIAAIRAQGIASDQISTVDYNLSAEQTYTDGADRTPRVTGYVATNTVRVEVKKIDGIGALIDATIAKGANEVSSLDFHSSAPDSLRRVALADAYQQAAADASVLAKAAGGRLGELIELSTSGQAGGPVPMVSYMKAKAAASTPINVGEQGATVGVMARWRFVEGAK